jgi:hypothetical protein
VLQLLPEKKIRRKSLIVSDSGDTFRTFALDVISKQLITGKIVYSLGTCDFLNDYMERSMYLLIVLNREYFDNLLQEYPGNMSFRMSPGQLETYTREELEKPYFEQDETFCKLNTLSDNVSSILEKSDKELPTQQWLIPVPDSNNSFRLELHKVSMEPVYQHVYTEGRHETRTLFEVQINDSILAFSMLELLYWNYDQRVDIIQNIFENLCAEV